MATYTAITDAEIDQDSPITQTLMTKYRDNLIATAERAAGAPRVNVCERTLIYSGGSVSTIESDDFEDGYFYRFIFENIDPDGGNNGNYVAIDFMKESDSTYVGTFPTSYLRMGVFSPAGRTNGVVTVFAPRVTGNYFSAYGFLDATADTTTFSTKAEGVNFNGGRVYVGATATKIKRVRFWQTDGVTGSRNFLTGNIYQEKLNLDI